MNRHRPRRALLGLAAATVLATGLAGCGQDVHDPIHQTALQTAPNGAVYDDNDVAFATDMIPHHEQALAMVRLTYGRTLSPSVRQLVGDIKTTQGSEIEMMSRWLRDWGRAVPHASDSGGDGGTDGMSGMMTAAQMAQLRDATDADFQQLWLAMMIAHHEGALTMAAQEQQGGTYRPALNLAIDVMATQQAQIGTMQDVLSDF